MTSYHAHAGIAAAAHYGTWVSFGGNARIALAVVLAAAAGGVAYAGTRMPLPLRPARPSEKARLFMIVAWAFAITAFLVCVGVYIQQMRREHLLHVPPADPITPVTFIAAGGLFVAILIIGSPRGWQVALPSAAIGAMAAPMIFELPFDLVVMARTYPPLPPDPALYRAVFFAPLVLIEVTTLSLLTLSPLMRLSRVTFAFVALMLAVFAVWGLFGFAYPSAPVPITLNVVSKLLAFAAALSLFLPQRAQASTPGPAVSPPAELVAAGHRHVCDR
jgi:hypothetical protein